MKMKLVTLTAAMMLGIGAARAQDVTVVHVWDDPGRWWGNHFVYERDNRYTAQELSLDGFATFTAREGEAEDIFKTNIRHGRWGGGAGVNYFFTRELGIGGDVNIIDNGGNFIDYASGSLILRMPLDPTGLAPYIFGGGGRQTQPVWNWTAHAGVGLEYRFNPWTGIFADARYIWADKTSAAIGLRTGLRFVF